MALDLCLIHKLTSAMKKIILSVFAIAALQLVQAQNQPAAAPAAQQRTQPSPEQVATRQTNHLDKVLTLTEEQKQKIYQAALTRNASMQQLKGANAGNRKQLHAAAAPVKAQYVKDVNATLTPEQQQKWEQYRLEQKQKQEARKGQQTAPAPNGAAPVNNAAPAKLEPHDDGINDN
jgi:hypothetical protein